MATPLILEYNLEQSQKLKLRFVCAQLKIAVRSVPKADYCQPLGALAGISPRSDKTYEGDGFVGEMIVMVNFNNELLHAFLNTSRQTHMRTIPLKAVLTPTNAAWDSVRLHDEVEREHKAMQKGKR